MFIELLQAKQFSQVAGEQVEDEAHSGDADIKRVRTVRINLWLESRCVFKERSKIVKLGHDLSDRGTRVRLRVEWRLLSKLLKTKGKRAQILRLRENLFGQSTEHCMSECATSVAEHLSHLGQFAVPLDSRVKGPLATVPAQCELRAKDAREQRSNARCHRDNDGVCQGHSPTDNRPSIWRLTCRRTAPRNSSYLRDWVWEARLVRNSAKGG